MYRLPYFPFPHESYQAVMDTSALLEDRLIEIDSQYREEIALKSTILEGNIDSYCKAPLDTALLQWEAVEILLPNLCRYYPEHFELAIRGEHWDWRNHLLGEAESITFGDEKTLPRTPLEWLGRQVQEDVILMAETPTGEISLVAGLLCFGAHWSLEEKIGKSFLDIHDLVPQFEMGMARPAELLMKRLKSERPVERVNWSLSTTDRLNLSPMCRHEREYSGAGITLANAGERVYLRLERQTLTRMPRTGGVLFTIRTYLAPISELADEPDKRRRFQSVIQTLPDSVSDYKGITPYREALLQYLQKLENTERHD